MTKIRLTALALAASAALACAPTAQARRTYELGYQAAQVAAVYVNAGIEAYGTPCPVQGIYVDVQDPKPGQRALANRGTQPCVIHLNRKADFGRELCYAVVDVVARMNRHVNTQGNPTCEAQPRAAIRRRSSSRRGH